MPIPGFKSPFGTLKNQLGLPQYPASQLMKARTSQDLGEQISDIRLAILFGNLYDSGCLNFTLLVIHNCIVFLLQC